MFTKKEQRAVYKHVKKLDFVKDVKKGKIHYQDPSGIIKMKKRKI